MARQEVELLPEHMEGLARWVDRVVLRLGIPPTHITYRAEDVRTLSGPLVLCTVAVLPHPALPGFPGMLEHST